VIISYEGEVEEEAYEEAKKEEEEDEGSFQIDAKIRR